MLQLESPYRKKGTSIRRTCCPASGSSRHVSDMPRLKLKLKSPRKNPVAVLAVQ